MFLETFCAGIIRPIDNYNVTLIRKIISLIDVDRHVYLILSTQVKLYNGDFAHLLLVE